MTKKAWVGKLTLPRNSNLSASAFGSKPIDSRFSDRFDFAADIGKLSIVSKKIFVYLPSTDSSEIPNVEISA